MLHMQNFENSGCGPMLKLQLEQQRPQVGKKSIKNKLDRQTCSSTFNAASFACAIAQFVACWMNILICKEFESLSPKKKKNVIKTTLVSGGRNIYHGKQSFRQNQQHSVVEITLISMVNNILSILGKNGRFMCLSLWLISQLAFYLS